MAATLQLPARRIAGAAGLGYVIAAGVENMELLRAPLPGASADAIRAGYADEALVTVTAGAGVLSLLLYAAFAVALAPRLPRRGTALAAGLLAPALALAGIAASLPLVLGADLSDAAVRSASELQFALRLLAGPFMAMFLVCAAGAVPRRLGIAGRALALPLALAPAAGLAGAHAAALVAFGLGALWIWLASLWLLAGGVAPALLVRRAAFLMLVLAAGLVGAALLAVPEATGAFFAWGLGPAPLAAFAGGVYVGSAVLYAAALRAPWPLARPFVAGAVLLSVSVFAVTILHLDLFDLGRLQAWAWLVLFAGFAAVTTGLLLAGGPAADDEAPLASWARGLLAGVALVLAVTAVLLWVDPPGLPDLGGRFAGSWTALLAFLAGWAAVAGGCQTARLPALALIALPAGALLGAARTEADLPYVGALLALIACGAAVRRAALGTAVVSGTARARPGASPRHAA